MKTLSLIILLFLFSCAGNKNKECLQIFTPKWAVGNYKSDQLLDAQIKITDKVVFIDMRGYETKQTYNSNNCRYEATDLYLKVTRKDIGYIIQKDSLKISVIYDPYGEKPTYLTLGKLIEIE